MATDPYRDLFASEVDVNSQSLLSATSLGDAPFVDGLLEAMDPDVKTRRSRQTGRIALFQFKRRARFRIPYFHLEYYQRCSIPVMLVWCKTGGGEKTIASDNDHLDNKYGWCWAHDVWLSVRTRVKSLSSDISVNAKSFKRWNSTAIRDDILKFCKRTFPTWLAEGESNSLMQVRLEYAQAMAGLIALSTGPGSLPCDEADLANWRDIMNSQCSPTRGRVLGARYTTEGEAYKRGSFAYIAKGIDTWMNNKSVAIKTFNPDYLGHAAGLLTLKNAAAIGERLQGYDVVPHIEPIRLDEHGLWTVLPWMAGGSLQDRAGSGEWLEDSFQVVEFLIGLAKVVLAAHSLVDPATGAPAPVYHRDIHPGNILFSGDGDWQPYLSDWDMGFDAQSKAHLSASLGLGMLVYRHPEYLAGREVRSPSLDLFGLCRIGRVLLLPAIVAIDPNISSEQLKLQETGNQGRLGEHGKRVHETLMRFERASVDHRESIASLSESLHELCRKPWEAGEKLRAQARADAERKWRAEKEANESWHDRQARLQGYGDAGNQKYWGSNE